MWRLTHWLSNRNEIKAYIKVFYEDKNLSGVFFQRKKEQKKYSGGGNW